MCKDITWEEVEKQIKNENNIVLLGNGFSRSYDSEIFNQKKILEDMPSLQGKNGINDIEVLIENTKENIIVNNQNEIASLDYIKKWVEDGLRLEFISTLLENMPKSIKQKQDKKSKEYDPNTLEPYRKFLSCFDKIFTLNYDPILYWMTLRLNGDFKDDINAIATEAVENGKINPENKKYIDKLLTEKAKIMKKLSEDKEYNIKISKQGISVLNEELSAKRANKLMKDDIWKEIVFNINSEQSLMNKFFTQIDLVSNLAQKSINCEIEVCMKSLTELNVPQNDCFYKNDLTGYGEWESDKTDNQEIFYLHGAYHYFHKKGKNIKIISVEKDDFKITMLQQVKNLLSEGYYPTAVLTDSAPAKMDKIKENDYLRHCFESFENHKGNLVTFGLSFMESDEHIVKAIKNNIKLEKVFIGYHTDEDERQIKKAFEGLDNVYLYPTVDFFKKLEQTSSKELVCAK